MTAIGIPKDVQSSAQQIVERFNRANLRSSAAYVARFKGMYLYLDRKDYGSAPVEICRLKYKGALNNWEFAIFKHSSNRYDCYVPVKTRRTVPRSGWLILNPEQGQGRIAESDPA